MHMLLLVSFRVFVWFFAWDYKKRRRNWNNMKSDYMRRCMLWFFLPTLYTDRERQLGTRSEKTHSKIGGSNSRYEIKRLLSIRDLRHSKKLSPTDGRELVDLESRRNFTFSSSVMCSMVVLVEFKIWNEFQANFTSVTKTEEFLLLGETELFELLSSDSLNVSTEAEVFEALRCWLYHNQVKHVVFRFFDLKTLS